MNSEKRFPRFRLSAALLLILALVFSCMLSGCGFRRTKEPEPTPEPTVETTPTPTPEPTPEPTPTYDLNFTVGGQAVSESLTSLDLSQAAPSEVDRLISVLPALPNLHSIDIGTVNAETPAIPWDQILALKQGIPGLAVNGTVTFGGWYTVSLSDTLLNLNHIPFTDEGDAAWKVAQLMPNLQTLDMDSCGVSNASMGKIRDSLPNVNVVWRVWFGTGYSVRTDVDRILASNPDRGGELTPDKTDGLYYCTKTKYLDLGHNTLLRDISFCRNMPELEVLIISMTGVSDLSPLASCPNLNYLEFATSGAGDLSPLSGLTKLKDVNLCYSFALCDIRPLYNLDLDRLWIGCLDPVPREQIEEYARLHPNCTINTTTENPTEEEWRTLDDYYPPQAAPRYAQLYEEFQYANFPNCYAYTENDPKVYSRFEY